MLCSVVAYSLGTTDKLNAVAWFAGFATLNVMGILVRCRWALSGEVQMSECRVLCV